jgi:hypothetical protein
VDKGELKWLISELNDKNTVIKGYAQMALKCDHPNWTKRYITSIIQQIDKITAVTAIITDLYLSGSDDSGDSDNDNCSKSAALENLIARSSNIKFH